MFNKNKDVKVIDKHLVRKNGVSDMLTRNMDYKIKLLKENGFTYTGDRYTHSGFDIYCYKIKEITDGEFRSRLEWIMEQLERLNTFKEGIFINCESILENKYTLDFAGKIK